MSTGQYALQEIAVAFLLTSFGLLLAYHGRKFAHYFRHIFGFLCAFGIFILLLKAHPEYFHYDRSSVFLLAVGVIFGILGVLAVHFMSSLLTIAIGALLGQTIYNVITTFPYVYEHVIEIPLARHLIMAVCMVSSVLFVHYFDYMAIITATAIVGSFMTIIGSDIIIRSGIGNVFFHGITEYQNVTPNFWTWFQLFLFVAQSVVGSLFQLVVF